MPAYQVSQVEFGMSGRGHTYGDFVLDTSRYYDIYHESQRIVMTDAGLRSVMAYLDQIGAKDGCSFVFNGVQVNYACG